MAIMNQIKFRSSGLSGGLVIVSPPELQAISEAMCRNAVKSRERATGNVHDNPLLMLCRE